MTPTLRTSIIYSCQNQNLKATRMMTKKYEDDKNKLDANEHQIPDYLSTLMKTIKGRANATLAANDERLQFLNPFVI
jgi:hypothetical protein